RSVVLFALAALTEIGGCWLVWQGLREHRGPFWGVAGVAGLGLYGFAATPQPGAPLRRILAAPRGLFGVASLVWGIVVGQVHPHRWDYAGAALCLVGMAVMMYAPR